MKSKLIRVDTEFDIQLRNIQKSIGNITYPKLTKKLVPYMKRIKISGNQRNNGKNKRMPVAFWEIGKI